VVSKGRRHFWFVSVLGASPLDRTGPHSSKLLVQAAPPISRNCHADGYPSGRN